MTTLSLIAARAELAAESLIKILSMSDFCNVVVPVGLVAAIKELINPCQVPKTEDAPVAESIIDDKEKSFVEKIDSYSGELWALSNDVDWYVFKDLLTRVNNGLTKEELKHIVESEYQHIPYKCKSTDISNIIEVWNYDIAKHNRDIISVRVNQALNVLSYEEIRTSIFDFLDYEKKKIESTITKSIGGEESQEKNRKKTNKSQLCNRPTKINSN